MFTNFLHTMEIYSFIFLLMTFEVVLSVKADTCITPKLCENGEHLCFKCSLGRSPESKSKRCKLIQYNSKDAKFVNGFRILKSEREMTYSTAVDKEVGGYSCSFSYPLEHLGKGSLAFKIEFWSADRIYHGHSPRLTFDIGITRSNLMNKQIKSIHMTVKGNSKPEKAEHNPGLETDVYYPQGIFYTLAELRSMTRGGGVRDRDAMPHPFVKNKYRSRREVRGHEMVKSRNLKSLSSEKKNSFKTESKQMKNDPIFEESKARALKSTKNRKLGLMTYFIKRELERMISLYAGLIKANQQKLTDSKLVQEMSIKEENKPAFSKRVKRASQSRENKNKKATRPVSTNDDGVSREFNYPTVEKDESGDIEKMNHPKEQDESIKEHEERINHEQLNHKKGYYRKVNRNTNVDSKDWLERELKLLGNNNNRGRKYHQQDRRIRHKSYRPHKMFRLRNMKQLRVYDTSPDSERNSFLNAEDRQLKELRHRRLIQKQKHSDVMSRLSKMETDLSELARVLEAANIFDGDKRYRVHLGELDRHTKPGTVPTRDYLPPENPTVARMRLKRLRLNKLVDDADQDMEGEHVSTEQYYDTVDDEALDGGDVVYDQEKTQPQDEDDGGTRNSRKKRSIKSIDHQTNEKENLRETNEYKREKTPASRSFRTLFHNSIRSRRAAKSKHEILRPERREPVSETELELKKDFVKLMRRLPASRRDAELSKKLRRGDLDNNAALDLEKAILKVQNDEDEAFRKGQIINGVWLPNFRRRRFVRKLEDENGAMKRKKEETRPKRKRQVNWYYDDLLANMERENHDVGMKRIKHNANWYYGNDVIVRQDGRPVQEEEGVLFRPSWGRKERRRKWWWNERGGKIYVEGRRQQTNNLFKSKRIR